MSSSSLSLNLIKFVESFDVFGIASFNATDQFKAQTIQTHVEVSNYVCLGLDEKIFITLAQKCNLQTHNPLFFKFMLCTTFGHFI